MFAIFVCSFPSYLRHGIILNDSISASDNIAALALKALLEYNRISAIEIKNIYIYIYILRMRISKRSYIESCNERIFLMPSNGKNTTTFSHT